MSHLCVIYLINHNAKEENKIEKNRSIALSVIIEKQSLCGRKYICLKINKIHNKNIEG